MNYTNYVLKRGGPPIMSTYNLNDGIIRILADEFREIAVHPYTLDMCMTDAIHATPTAGMNLDNINSYVNHAWTSSEVYAWCRTCNQVEPGSGNFGKGTTTLPRLLWATHQHLSSAQHRDRHIVAQERAERLAALAELDAEQAAVATMGTRPTHEPCSFHGPDELCPICTG